MLELPPCDDNHQPDIDYDDDDDNDDSDDDDHKCVLYVLVPFCRRRPELL